MQDNIVSKSEAMKSLKKLPIKKMIKMSMKDSAKFLFSSPYIRDLAILVISFGMCGSFLEGKAQASLSRPQLVFRIYGELFFCHGCHHADYDAARACHFRKVRTHFLLTSL